MNTLISEEMEHNYMFWHLRDMEKLAEGIEIGRTELREELRQELREEVRQEGIEIGRQEGVEIGRKEMLQERNLEFAINMLPDFDDAFIAKYSQLSIEEVARIREEHSN